MAFASFDARNASAPMSEINMVPLIDVMLVLLVIFMITAPLMTSSLKLDLPKADGAKPNDAPQFISVAIDPQGKLYIGEEGLDAPAFAQRIAETARNNPRTEVQLRADTTVPYGRVAELIDMVQKAGLNRIGFVTAPAGTGTGKP